MIRKPDGENDVRVVFFSQDYTRKLDLNVIDASGVHNCNSYQNKGKDDNGTSMITLKDIHKKEGIYRFYAHILEPEKLANETLKIFYFNCDTVKVIESPIL